MEAGGNVDRAIDSIVVLWLLKRARDTDSVGCRVASASYV